MFWGHSRGPFGLFTDRFSSLIGSQFAEDDLQTYVAQTLTLRELRVALDMQGKVCSRTSTSSCSRTA